MTAVDVGMSRRAAAGRFGVSVSSVIRWDAQRRQAGSFAPKPQGGDMRSRRIEARHAEVMAALEEEPDQSLMDNLSSHKRASVRAMIEARGVLAALQPRLHQTCRGAALRRLRAGGGAERSPAPLATVAHQIDASRSQLDTIACVAGAHHGVPREFDAKVRARLNERLNAVLAEFEARHF